MLLSNIQEKTYFLVIKETTTNTTRDISAANISTGAPKRETPLRIPHKATIDPIIRDAKAPARVAPFHKKPPMTGTKTPAVYIV